MSEPQPRAQVSAEPIGDLSTRDADRESRIEQLLLSGLDHYFAGKYEQAITIWTRVAFLERGYGRARAYIERARGAMAERQRECEELIHDGITAYQAGDMDAARMLLTRAIDEGGPTDTALAFLQRLNRFEAAADASRTPVPRPADASDAALVAASPSRKWLPTAVAGAAIAAAVIVVTLPVTSWIAERPVAGPADVAVREPLPVVRSSDLELARARTLGREGRPREALRLLDRIDVADPRREDADRLRADLQRDLLAAIPVAEHSADSGGSTR